MTTPLRPDDLVCDMPNGTRVVYRNSDHSYWVHPEDRVKGESPRLMGVSTASKMLDGDPSRLLTWAALKQLEGVVELGVAELSRTLELQGADADSLWRVLKAKGLTWEDVRDRAGTRGTNIHRQVFENLCRGETPLPPLMSDEERGYAEAVVKFWNDYDPSCVHFEKVVYSKRLRVAGRLDFYGLLNDDHEGYGIIDVKTSGYLGAAAHCQVGGGYPLLLEESGFGTVDWALMLQVSADGEYTLVEAEATPGDFELAVGAYRAAGRINSTAAKARKARE